MTVTDIDGALASPQGRDRRILIVDDDVDFADGLVDLLDFHGYSVTQAHDPAAAMAAAEAHRPEIAFIDIRLGRSDGFELLARLSETYEDLICVMMTAHVEIETAIEAIRRGAYDYLRKPLRHGELLVVLSRCFEKLRLARERVESEARLRAIFDNVVEGIITITAAGTVETLNRAAEEMFGYSAAEIVGRDVSILMPAADRTAHAGYIERYHETGQGRILGVRSRELEGRRKDGTQFPIELNVSRFDTADGVHFIGAVRDITARRETRRARLESERRLADAVDSIADGLVVFDRDDRLVLCNTAYRNFYPRLEDLLTPGAHVEDIARAGFHRGAIVDGAEDVEAWVRLRMTQHHSGRGTHEQKLADGRRLLCRDKKTRDGYTVCIRTDITELKEREERLRRSQKMEAIGQITGGVAHDFNNLLGIVIGNLDFLDEALRGNDDLRDLVETATRAALRGAALTRHLLAFARQQPLTPEVLDINALIGDMGALLRRTMGPAIAVEVTLEPGLRRVRVDPAQLESALLNLALNARHAMPDGGRLTIETASRTIDDDSDCDGFEAPPSGRYVAIIVTDTGCGMSPSVREQAFQPFFTTREVGQGSGLGLSMVHGFIRQSGGGVKIDSAPGEGASVTLCLPALDLRVTEGIAEQPPPPRGNGEVIIVVEDDPALRATTEIMLTELGYLARSAGDGESALALIDTANTVDILLTEVALPGGIDGAMLAEQCEKRHPDVRVVFTSAEAPTDCGAGLIPGHGAGLLRKPYRRDDLAHRISRTLVQGD